jgi:hypothetical protein
MRVAHTSKQCVIAVFPQGAEAERAFGALQSRQLPQLTARTIDTVSEARQFLRGYLPADDHSRRNAVWGAIAGACVGGILGFAIMSVPSTGGDASATFMLPLLLAVAGIFVGGFIGAMNGWERPRNPADEYETAVEQGQALVVAAGSPEDVVEASQVLKQCHPESLEVRATTADDHVD